MSICVTLLFKILKHLNYHSYATALSVAVMQEIEEIPK